MSFNAAQLFKHNHGLNNEECQKLLGVHQGNWSDHLSGKKPISKQLKASIRAHSALTHGARARLLREAMR